MTPEAFTEYLHREIPLTAAMSARVVRSEPGEVEICAPLAPNKNLHGTAFAGSLATLGLISGWVVLDRALHGAQVKAHLVAQKNECIFHAPATQELRLSCADLARVPGTYSGAGLTVTIEERPDGLFADTGGPQPERLVALSPTRFRTDARGIVAQFAPDYGSFDIVEGGPPLKLVPHTPSRPLSTSARRARKVSALR